MTLGTIINRRRTEEAISKKALIFHRTLSILAHLPQIHSGRWSTSYGLHLFCEHFYILWIWFWAKLRQSLTFRPYSRNIVELFVKPMPPCEKGHSPPYIYVGASWVFGPIVLPQPFPTDAEYPFSTESLFTHSIVYMHQFTVGVQVAAAMSHSGFAALLLWFTAARFECLMLELRETSNAFMLIKCIKKQIQLRR